MTRNPFGKFCFALLISSSAFAEQPIKANNDMKNNTQNVKAQEDDPNGLKPDDVEFIFENKIGGKFEIKNIGEYWALEDSDGECSGDTYCNMLGHVGKPFASGQWLQKQAFIVNGTEIGTIRSGYNTSHDWEEDEKVVEISGSHPGSWHDWSVTYNMKNENYHFEIKPIGTNKYQKIDDTSSLKWHKYTIAVQLHNGPPPSPDSVTVSNNCGLGPRATKVVYHIAGEDISNGEVKHPKIRDQYHDGVPLELSRSTWSGTEDLQLYYSIAGCYFEKKDAQGDWQKAERCTWNSKAKELYLCQKKEDE